jgi:hypothetical protein
LQVKDHARQLLEKYVGKPFFDALYAGNQPRMSPEEVESGLAWLDDRFHVIRHEDDGLPSIDWVLDLARAAVLRWASLAQMVGGSVSSLVECTLYVSWLYCFCRAFRRAAHTYVAAGLGTINSGEEKGEGWLKRGWIV